MNRQRACECLAILTIGEVISEEKKRQHQGRTRAWIKRREEKGYFSNVVRDLKTENTVLQCNALNVMKIFKVILRVRRRFSQHCCGSMQTGTTSLPYSFSGHRTTEMLGLVVPKVQSIRNKRHRCCSCIQCCVLQTKNVVSVCMGLKTNAIQKKWCTN